MFLATIHLFVILNSKMYPRTWASKNDKFMYPYRPNTNTCIRISASLQRTILYFLYFRFFWTVNLSQNLKQRTS